MFSLVEDFPSGDLQPVPRRASKILFWKYKTMLMGKSLRLAVVGLGRIGQMCAEVISKSHDLSLAALILRAVTVEDKLPDMLRHVPVFTHIGQAGDVDGALICVPSHSAEEVAYQILQHGIPIVDCVTLHGEAYQTHKDAIHKWALHHKAAAIVGAGWDPGGLSLFRSLFAILAPDGYTETSHRVGVSLHHTAMARQITGVREALCTEQHAPDGRRQRYVYVELEQGADADRVTDAICADPLFLGDETLVFPVESIAALEQEAHGVLLERRGAPGRLGHQQFLLEARFDESLMTAHMMLAAARALPQLKPGAYSLLDLRLSSLLGDDYGKAEREWL